MYLKGIIAISYSNSFIVRAINILKIVFIHTSKSDSTSIVITTFAQAGSKLGKTRLVLGGNDCFKMHWAYNWIWWRVVLVYETDGSIKFVCLVKLCPAIYNNNIE